MCHFPLSCFNSNAFNENGISCILGHLEFVVEQGLDVLNQISLLLIVNVFTIVGHMYRLTLLGWGINLERALLDRFGLVGLRLIRLDLGNVPLKMLRVNPRLVAICLFGVQPIQPTNIR